MSKSKCSSVEEKAKPPVGIISKKVYYDSRINEIINAINEYRTANIVVPLEWIEEYNILINLKNSDL